MAVGVGAFIGVSVLGLLWMTGLLSSTKSARAIMESTALKSDGLVMASVPNATQTVDAVHDWMAWGKAKVKATLELSKSTLNRFTQ